MAIGAFSVAMMTLMVVYGVFMRYVINRPPIFVEQVSGHLLVALSFCGMAYVLKIRRHITIDIVVRRLSQRSQYLLEVLSLITCLCYCGLLAWMGVRLVLSSWEIKAFPYGPLMVPLVIPQSGMAIGLVLLVITVIVVIVDRIKILQRLGKQSD